MQSSEQLYYKDLDRYKLNSPEEEKVILEEVKKGSQKALHCLILGNLRFVVSIAKHYRGRGLTLLELINEGNLGLHKAAKKFDPDKGVKFISYAVWWIRQTIQTALLEQVGTMRIPLNKLALVNKFKKALKKNNGNFEKTLSQEQFRDFKQDIIEVMDKLVNISLDAPIKRSAEFKEDESSLLSMIGGEGEQIKESEKKELERVVDEILNKLSNPEQKVLRMYYGINYSREFTLEEIGKELKLTRERVRQIKNKALKKLLKSKKSKEALSAFATSRNRSDAK